jgi:hypothetical protein
MMVERLLVVEGRDDKHVFSAILNRHQFAPSFEIQDEGGFESLLARLSVRLKPGTDVKCIGIVVDADANAKVRWQSLKATLNRAGYASTPDEPDLAGSIVDHETLPRVGVWIMPNNTLPGMLEDYLRFLVPARDHLFERANRCVGEIPAEERRFAEHHSTKALIHTWLAWQADPGTPLGLAITKRYFESDGPHVDAVLEWLRRLFV